MTLERHLGPATSLLPGQWSSETASGLPAVGCPGCGQVDELLPHSVDPTTGDVDGVWACSSCDFTDCLLLANYTDEVLT